MVERSALESGTSQHSHKSEPSIFREIHSYCSGLWLALPVLRFGMSLFEMAHILVDAKFLQHHRLALNGRRMTAACADYMCLETSSHVADFLESEIEILVLT